MAKHEYDYDMEFCSEHKCHVSTCKEEHKKVSYDYQTQRVMLFASYKRDHSAVWELMEFIPNSPGTISPERTMQDRTGQWWLMTRNLFNTNEEAEKYLSTDFYQSAYITVEYLSKKGTVCRDCGLTGTLPCGCREDQ